jgi:hypothetical protein
MLDKGGRVLVLTALLLGAAVVAANAGCEGRKTTGTLLGAGAGSVALGALTHSPAGWIGGAVVGGFAGHSIASDNCHYSHHYRNGYYDRYHRWHSYG